MTIKEIAKLAGVSVSTVSKIVNGKDENINVDTRNRVLKIVKDYNYSPYSFVKNASQAKTFCIAVVLKESSANFSLINGVIDAAKSLNYQVTLIYNTSPEDELMSITALCKNRVDGIIWEQFDGNSEISQKQLADNNIPYICIDSEPDMSATSINFSKLGELAAESLIQKKHQKIAYITDNQFKHENTFFEGFKQCLFQNMIPYSDSMYINHVNSQLIDTLLINEFTAAICTSREIALTIYEELDRLHRKIPRDFSLICLQDDLPVRQTYPKLSHLEIPYYDYGGFLCNYLIEELEKLHHNKEFFDFPEPVIDDRSIDIPRTIRSKHIVVVGSIHMDINLNVKECPQVGKSIEANHCAFNPGGKGANQAVGVAKLGKEIFLIGKVGNDYEGTVILDFLQKNGVNIQGISRDEYADTGKAFIHILEDGESTITFYPAANNRLTPEDIDKNTASFKNARFCLIQTEISLETIERAAELAKANHVETILKPSAVPNLSDHLLEMLDYFVPNQKEINYLCPGLSAPEEQTAYFIEKGVKNVILTAGHNGCYLRTKDLFKHFPALPFTPVDTTGAADAFIAALSVYLSEDRPITEAIQYATGAAGFCITREGVTSAMIDRISLETYMSKQRN
ncbi:LacI family DNA-binding transcriptional regulator [Anaerocolumna sedimenticola]|uniref:Ribokinase n=1 Tax=Anaerocolumna sedimenticola TaxID=2696063 RepID=A0A6P1TM35_9FIRM|nr:PfkB family carbohydrate kinase [Anaerocolumna sedimenticola]QHQ60916.1 LacI family DNA-binding transcriptional regulator [Anaerocolumna sedimenticola]